MKASLNTRKSNCRWSTTKWTRRTSTRRRWEHRNSVNNDNRRAWAAELHREMGYRADPTLRLTKWSSMRSLQSTESLIAGSGTS